MWYKKKLLLFSNCDIGSLILKLFQRSYSNSIQLGSDFLSQIKYIKLGHNKLGNIFRSILVIVASSIAYFIAMSNL